jgi:hypothetical protein
VSEVNFQLLKTTTEVSESERARLSRLRHDLHRRSEIRLDTGDSFVVSPWNWHEHENLSREPSLLFSINDRRAIEAPGFFREEAQA